MVRVGMTGGIGSGKSTVSRVFETLGVPVYYTDPRAKALMTTDPKIIAQLTALLGPQTYVDGILDRQYVASRIFTDRELIRQVNAMVHPRVAADFRRWAEEQSDAPYVILECAIMFESGFAELTDYVVTVSADTEQRVERASRRDGIEERQVRERMANQMTDDERESHADFTIHNSDHDMVLRQVLELHKFFTDESRK